jgi:hypothetical protein
MTAPIVGLRNMGRRLRELEEAIATQRKLIAAENTGCDGRAERENLKRLLKELEDLLAESELIRQREVEETLDRVLIDCPL